MPSRITLNANGGPEVLRLEQVQEIGRAHV